MEIENTTTVNFISCAKWIKRGVANTNPVKIQLSKNELVQIINDTKTKIQDASREEEPMEDGTATDEFGLEKYDSDDEINDTANTLGISSIAELDNDAQENFSESDDSDKEDDKIKLSDNLILVGHVEGDASMLEVYVYNEDEESLYVHHDIILPSFPLCVEPLNYEPKMPKGNYCAVGSMTPIIEVWDLDIMNVIEPAFTLGRVGNKKNKNPIGHTDAVLALAWNKTYEHILSSGSVDQTVLLWDMEIKKPSTTIKSFQEKVQCLDWHPLEGQTLLAGGCDKSARVFDCRTPESHQTWLLDGESERLCWNPLDPFTFLAGTSVGSVQCFDCRKGQLWSINAHEKEVTGLVISKLCQGLLVTSSTDETVKIWDFALENEPNCVAQKEFNLGSIHCLDLCPDLPFVLTVGGDKKSHNFTVFDIQNIDVVKHTFGPRGLTQIIPDV
ncbi:periodic tryptophan protein 1 homolog [Diorhabda carinulata]|uniref:periodic tryptophan protein 1 homolog n=1 Tax=Diorhabda sublineata TaxID=1163346 RepID=UPI0024E13057|nr:periodic tryptophan protein 1 homolog [Diorhabda sublineata]XP_057654190.1 periodic tryptophan protein 1 homolog [Diorhabda carinulata]